jgi:hypothetical protein
VDGEKEDWLFHSKGNTKGTTVSMKISIHSDKKLKNIFDAFTGDEDQDFAFNKTVVPVKLALYEGERLVSRSQAKRILNRVEKFSIVLLDFAGVDSIGQAFADEVFRVFARKNPQIQLTPIHVTEEVEKSIRAALSGSN